MDPLYTKIRCLLDYEKITGQNGVHIEIIKFSFQSYMLSIYYHFLFRKISKYKISIDNENSMPKMCENISISNALDF